MTSPATRVVVPAQQQVPGNIYVDIPAVPNGDDIVKTDIFDFTTITKIEAPRMRSVEYLILDDKGPPGKARGSGIAFDRDGNMQFRDQPNEDTNVVQVTTERGSTVKYRITFAIDVRFLIELARSQSLMILAIRATVPNPRFAMTHVPPPLGTQTFTLNQFLHPSAIQALVQTLSDRQNVPVFVEQFFTFEIDKETMDGINPEELRVAFEFLGFRQGRIADLGQMTFSRLLPYQKDKQVYYSVKNPVKIAAAAVAIDQTVVTVRKPINSRSRGVKIYKRRILPPSIQKDPETFEEVREIDFLSDLGIGINDDYEFTFLDESPTDNLLSYIYRAVPLGYDGAPSMTFDDIQTSPISQASYLEGEGRTITPIFTSTGDDGNTTTLSGKYFLVDPNFLPTQALVDPFPESVAVISSVVNRGVEIVASNFPEQTRVFPFSLSLVRRNLSKSERKFSLVKDRDSANRLISNAGELTFVDSDVLDQNVYEYAVEMTYTNGAKQRSNDTSVIRYEDFRLMSSMNAELSAEFEEIEAESVKINTQITFNQNLIDLITLLVGDRQQADVFIGDVQENRESLASIASLVIIRKNTTTGEEKVFSEEGLTNQDLISFEISDNEMNAGENQNVSNTVVRKRFTDRTITQGQNYRYEVTLNIRAPLDMTTKRTSVRPESGMPYVFQACKMRSPLLLRRGVLPPTPAQSDFITDQKFLDTGPARLLNRFTAQSDLELGSTNLRVRVPLRGSVTIPGSSQTLQLAPKQRYTRPGTSNLTFRASQSRSTVSHYRVQVRDIYRLNQALDWSRGNTEFVRLYDAAIIPGGQDVVNFEAEFSTPDLRQVDPLEFGRLSQPPMPDLQRAVKDGRVSVVRNVTVIPVLLSGKDGTPREATPASLTVVRSNQESIQYSEIVQ